MDEKVVVTTLLFDPETWRLLRGLAELRARIKGGRPSNSAVVRDLVKQAAADQARATKETGR